MLALGKALIGGSVAGLTFLILTATPSLANTHNQTATPTSASSASGETQPMQQNPNQTTAQTTPTPQQPNQTGCCCKKMMNNSMEPMMNNMPRTTGN